MQRRTLLRSLAAGASLWPLHGSAQEASAPGKEALPTPPAPSPGGWPQFRGPSGTGHGVASGLPLKWSETENVVWKTSIPHKGWSTPLVMGDQVWLTSATEDGHGFWVYALDRKTGKILHEAQLISCEKPEPLGNSLNCYAACTGFIEPGRVYLHFGSYGTICLDTVTFREIWRRTDLPCRHYRGPGSSVFPWKGLLILTMDGVDVQYLAALDRSTGATVWKTDRNTEFDDLEADGKPAAEGDYRKAYSTPVLINPGNGFQLVSTGSRATVSYDPDTGRELWRSRYKGFSNASQPAWVNGLLVLNTGHGKATLRAFRITPDTTGDITDSLVWEQTKYIPTRSSPVVAEGLIFVMADNGFISAVDPQNGELLFSERTGGSCSASPMMADGRLYFCNERGESYVVRPGRTYEELARNTLPDGIMAGPAAVDRDLFIRTKTHLYLLREP